LGPACFESEPLPNPAKPTMYHNKRGKQGEGNQLQIVYLRIRYKTGGRSGRKKRDKRK